MQSWAKFWFCFAFFTASYICSVCYSARRLLSNRQSQEHFLLTCRRGPPDREYWGITPSRMKMNIETLSHPPKPSAIMDSRGGETSNSELPSQAEPPDIGIIVTTSSLPPCGLPSEVWAHIFSYLSDFDLLRSVIPVNRFFRTLAYDVGFRNLSDLQTGGYWWIYDFSAAFLRAIPTPKKLQFRFSDKYVCLVDRDLPRQCLQLLENVQSGVESLKFDNFPASLLKIDSLKFPKLKELSIDDEHLSEAELEALGRFVDDIAPQLKTLRINFEPWYYPWFLKKLDQSSSIQSLTIRCPGKFFQSFSSALRCLVSLRLENGHSESKQKGNFNSLFRIATPLMMYISIVIYDLL